MHLAEKGRQQGEHDQPEQPRRIGRKPHREGQDGEDVLDLSEELRQQRGAAGDLPARPVEPVLLVAALELLEVEGGGLLHQAHAGEIAVALGEQAVDEGARPAEKVGRDGERGLHHDKAAQQVEPAARQPVAEARAGGGHLGLGDDLVDDELAHIEHEDRNRRPAEPQPEARRRKRGARLPHEPEQGGQMTKRADPLAQGQVRDEG